MRIRRKRIVQTNTALVALDLPTTGYDHPTQSLTATYARLNLAASPPGNYPLWVSGASYNPGTFVRAAVHELVSDAHMGTCSQFTPGAWTTNGENPTGEHYCGVGQVLIPDAVGDRTRVTLGMWMKFGSTYYTDLEFGTKHVIMLRESPSARPMLIPHPGSITLVPAACDGTVCNCTDDPADNQTSNDNNNLPDLNVIEGEQIYLEMQMDTNTARIQTKLWSTAGYQGTFRKNMTDNHVAGNDITALDIIGFVSTMPTPSAQPWYRMKRVEFWVGSAGDQGPPPGFPGSTR